jgi:biopolymer transport protein ExbB
MRRRSIPRTRLVVLCLTLVLGVWFVAFRAPTLAQDEPAKPAETPATTPGPPKTKSMLDTIKAGGLIGHTIILLSIVAMGFSIEHLITIRRERLIPQQLSEELDARIKMKKIDEAIRLCVEPRWIGSLLANVVLAGLERYKSSEFGFVEYRAAVEEAGEEQTARLYRKTEMLAVIGAIAPMLGLLGTVQGMIEAFDTIAATGGNAKPADLADSISKALVTTLEGLIVAIPTLSVLTFFRTRIDSLVSEAGKRVEQLLLPLGRQR